MNNSKIKEMDIELETVEFVSHVEEEPVFKLIEEVANNLEKHLVFDEWSQRDSDLVDEVPLMAREFYLRELATEMEDRDADSKFVTKIGKKFTWKYLSKQQTVELTEEVSSKCFSPRSKKVKLDRQVETISVNSNFLIIKSRLRIQQDRLITVISLKTLDKICEITLHKIGDNMFYADAIINDTFIYRYDSNIKQEQVEVYCFVRLADPTKHARFIGPAFGCDACIKYSRQFHPSCVFILSDEKLHRVYLDRINYQAVGIKAKLPADLTVDREFSQSPEYQGMNLIDNHAFIYGFHDSDQEVICCQLVDLKSMTTVQDFTIDINSFDDEYPPLYTCEFRPDFEIKVGKNKTIVLCATARDCNHYFAVSIVNGKAVVREGQAPKNLGSFCEMNLLEDKFKAKIVSSKEIRIMPITKH